MLHRQAGPFRSDDRGRRQAILLSTAIESRPANANAVPVRRKEQGAAAALRVVERTRTRVRAATTAETARRGAAISALLDALRAAGMSMFDSTLSDETLMSMPRFQRLVSQMPKIAKVVNQFETPEMQREVLQALIRAFESEEAEGDEPDLRRPNDNGHGVAVRIPAFVTDDGHLAVDHDLHDSSIHD
ncbi:MAG: hypothetical protein IT428_16885 [Planctomycetaceae bacterium]|nr:hypothetical protein [Planctomycetaceae bacterium]